MTCFTVKWLGMKGEYPFNNIKRVDMAVDVLLCRASIPVFTCIFGVVIEDKVPTTGEAVSLGILTLGVIVVVWEGNVTGSTRAIMLCLGGTLSSAAMMSTSGKVLSEKVDVLRLTFYTAPISFLVLLPALHMREVCSFIVRSFKVTRLMRPVREGKKRERERERERGRERERERERE
jgi:hypothetical protein